MDASAERLMAVAAVVLAPEARSQLDFEGANDEFGQRLCEAMATFGSGKFHCIATQEKRVLFLQQVFFVAFFMLLSWQQLVFSGSCPWV